MAGAKSTSEVHSTVQSAAPTTGAADAGLESGIFAIDQSQSAAVPVNVDIRSLKGLLKKPAVAVTIEEMNQFLATRRPVP